MAATNHTMGPPAPQPPPDPNFVIEHSGTAEMVSLGQPAPHRVCCCCFITCGHGIAPNRARRCRLRHTLNSPSLFPFNAAASLFPTTRAPVSGGTCQAVNGLPHDGPTPRLGVGGHPLHHSSEFALCSRGCTYAGAVPMRKPSRSSTHSRRPGVAQREEGQPLLPSRPGSLLQRTALRSALCRPPARPCPLFNPAWWF